MSSLKTSIYKAETIAELANILKGADADVSFFCQEVLKHNKYSSTTSISSVAKKAISLLNPPLKEWNFSLKERKNISIIMEKIDSSYAKTDEILHTTSFITRFFNFLWNLPCLIFSTRRRWEKLPDLTNFYTQKQYLEAFPRNDLPEDADDQYNNIPLYLPPDKVNLAWYSSFLISISG